MDAVELLQDKIDFIKILEHYDFDHIKQQGTLIRSCCKLHGGNNPSGFVVNTDNNLYYCHTGGCGGGDIFTLVQRIEDITFTQAVQWVADFFKLDISTLEIQERTESYMKEMKQWIKAMNARKKKELTEFSIPEPIKEVTKFRSFQPDTLQHFGLGWVEQVTLHNKEGKPYHVKNRLVFPIRINNQQVGLSFRIVNKNDYPKWSHQPPHIETSNILYNYDAVLGCEDVVVVEGIPDVWAFYEIGIPAVATFGAHLTDEQYKLLMRLGCDITFAYDGDDAGQLATSKAINAFRYKATIHVVRFEQGQDPENIERNQLKLLYESRERI